MYVRLIENVRRFCYLNCFERKQLTAIPKKRRYEVLIHFNSFISKSTLMFPAHRANDDWNEIIKHANKSFTSKQFQELTELLNRKPEANVRLTVTATEKETSLTNEQFIHSPISKPSKPS